MKSDFSLYLVTDRKLAGDRDLLHVIDQAISGGVTAVQLREKYCSTSEFCKLAEKTLKLTSQAQIPLIINDRIDVALAVGADGVHLGNEDMPYEIARQILGSDAIIGLTVSNMEEAAAVKNCNVNYIGVGPVFHTNTKEKAKQPIGVNALKEIIKSTPHTVVAIGGINHSNISSVIETGASGIALVSAIIGNQNPKDSAKKLLDLIREARINRSNIT